MATVPHIPYITAGELKDYTGARPVWFDLEDEAAMLSMLGEWVAHAEDLVTRFIGARYVADATQVDMSIRPRVITGQPPYGVKNAVLRIGANMVAQAKLRRSTVVMQLDEYTQRLVDDRIFTRAIKEDLAMYQLQEPEIGGGRAAGGSIPVSGMISRERFRVHPETFGDFERDLHLTSTKQDVIHYWYGRSRVHPDGERRV